VIMFTFLWDWPYHVAWGDITVVTSKSLIRE
jgi:hypothetical protein